MDRRLPSLREMVDMPQSRGTAPSLTPSWTAVNHRAEGPGSVSPQTHHPVPQVDAQHSPSDQRHDHGERPIPHQEQATADPSANFSAEPTYGRLSFNGAPARFSPGEHETAEKPITARQDSAVFPSAPAHNTAFVPPGSSSSRAGTSPELYYRAVLGDTAIHPLTPPSDPASTQPHPSHVSTHYLPHERPRDLLSARAQPELMDMPSQRSRNNSDSDPLKTTLPPYPQAALFQDRRNSMPPPPVPAADSPLEPATADMSSPPPSAATHHQTTKHAPNASIAEEEGSVMKCAFCNATWTFPPPDTTGIETRPAITYQDMQQKMDALTTFTSNYRLKKDADYERWKQLHSGGHCNCESGGKRKHEASVEDVSPPSKLRKRASQSPQRTSRLTPPPDRGADVAGQEPVYFEPKLGPRIPLNPNVARVIGRYIPPADDSNSMFYDAHGERKTVKTEETAH